MVSPARLASAPERDGGEAAGGAARRVDRAGSGRLTAARGMLPRPARVAGDGSGPRDRRAAGLRGSSRRRMRGAPEWSPRTAPSSRPGHAEAPGIAYEEGMRALPVDFRACRGAGAGRGRSGRRVGIRTGDPATAFVHVVDCRTPRRASGASPATTAPAAGGQPLPAVLALLRGLASLASAARKAGLSQGRLGVLPGPDRARRKRGAGQLPSQLQLRRRPRQLALGCRRVHRSAWGPSTGRLTCPAEATRATSTRRGPRGALDPARAHAGPARGRRRPPPAAPRSRSRPPGASPSTPTPRIGPVILRASPGDRAPNRLTPTAWSRI